MGKINNKHTYVVLAYNESPYLEECIKSVLRQRNNSKVIIATTTPNKFIINLAKKYSISVSTTKHTNIGGDFDFAKNCAETELVTIAHQDDIYDYDYSYNVIKQYEHFPDSTIIFTDYYEIRKNEKIETNRNLKFKRFLLKPLTNNVLSKKKFVKRATIMFGNSICCPAVSFVTKNTPRKLFSCNMDSNVDWFAWEKLSKIPGRFIYINKHLMGHRITDCSTTSNIINSGKRTEEDLKMFKKFWPNWLANKINNIYKNSESSNNIN